MAWLASKLQYYPKTQLAESLQTGDYVVIALPLAIPTLLLPEPYYIILSCNDYGYSLYGMDWTGLLE